MSIRREATAQLVARILELLDTPMPPESEQAACQCMRCRRARRRPLRCRVCGYRGEPFVYPCECTPLYDTASPEALAWYGTMLREAEANGAETTVTELREQIAALLTDGRMPLCGIDGHEQGCCHGDRACPICHATHGDPQSLQWTDEDRVFHAWNVIRGIRQLVAKPARRGAVR